MNCTYFHEVTAEEKIHWDFVKKWRSLILDEPNGNVFNADT